MWGLAGEAGRVPRCVPGVTCCCLHRANATRTPWRRWARQTQGVGAVRRRPSSRCQAASLGGHTGSPGGRSSSALPQIWPHAHARQLPHTLVPSSLPTPHPRVALGLHLLCLCPLSPHSVPGPPSPVFRLLSQRCLPLPSSIPTSGHTHRAQPPPSSPALVSDPSVFSGRPGGRAGPVAGHPLLHHPWSLLHVLLPPSDSPSFPILL